MLDRKVISRKVRGPALSEKVRHPLVWVHRNREGCVHFGFNFAHALKKMNQPLHNRVTYPL